MTIYNMIEIVGLIGITIIITNGIVTEKLRQFVLLKFNLFGRMLSCAMCVGMWAGLLFSFFILHKMKINTILYDILYGGMISIVSHSIDTILEKFKLTNDILRNQGDQR